MKGEYYVMCIFLQGKRKRYETIKPSFKCTFQIIRMGDVSEIHWTYKLEHRGVGLVESVHERYWKMQHSEKVWLLQN